MNDLDFLSEDQERTLIQILLDDGAIDDSAEFDAEKYKVNDSGVVFTELFDHKKQDWKWEAMGHVL